MQRGQISPTLEKMGVKFEVLSNSDARSSPDSALNTLSEQQKQALFSAYADGYYEVPSKVNLETLAEQQHVNKSTFAEHLMKAENRVISRILADELSYMRPGERLSQASSWKTGRLKSNPP